MGTNTIPEREDGLPNGVVDATWFNALRQALSGVLVGRDASTGAPLAGQELGTLTYPWGAIRANQLIVDGSLIDFTGLNVGTHKVVSGKMRSTSNQPAYLTPSGSGASFDLKAASVPLNIEVSGEAGSFSTDVTVSGLTTAPSSNNTCLLDAITAISQEATRTWGEPESGIDLAVDAMGSEITALVGTYAAFRIVNGGNTEYFIAFVKSSTVLRSGFRGFFYNSSLAPMNRIALADNNVITLMKLHWVFADINGTTVSTTANAPKFDATEPGSPSTGDYWFDQVNAVWKRYDGAAFQTVQRVLIGYVIVNSTDCIGARCVEFSAGYSPDTSIKIEVTSNSVVQGSRMGQRISVAGNYHRFQTARAYWDMATDLAAAADMYNSTEQASRAYYFYLKDTGAEVISDISPYFRGEMSGWYHPHNPWRCVGKATNDGSSNLTASSAIQYMLEGKIDSAMIETAAIIGRHLERDIDLPGFPTLNGGFKLVTGNANNSSNLKVTRGSVSSAGAVVAGEGYGATKNSTGNYTITFSTNFLAAPAVVVGFGNTSTSGLICYVSAVSTSAATIQIRDGSANPQDQPFNFVAIGT